MDNNRRSFLQGLMALPFVGWAFKGIAQEPPIEQVIDEILDDIPVRECIYHGTFTTDNVTGQISLGDLVYIDKNGKITSKKKKDKPYIGICTRAKDEDGFIEICTNGKLWIP